MKALTAFFRILFGAGGCVHLRVNFYETPIFCQDCGYLVKIQWWFVCCRRCHTKRIPRRTLWGDIRPIEPYCRRCGYEGFQLIQKSRIEAYELPYALCSKSIDYSETPSCTESSIQSPFRPIASLADHEEIVEAEIIQKREFFCRSSFGSIPIEWQIRQNYRS